TRYQLRHKSFPTRRSSDLCLFRKINRFGEIILTEVNNLFQQVLVFIENVENQEEIFSLIGKELQEKELVNEEFVNALLNREKNQDRKSTRLNSSHVSISYA